MCESWKLVQTQSICYILSISSQLTAFCVFGTAFMSLLFYVFCFAQVQCQQMVCTRRMVHLACRTRTAVLHIIHGYVAPSTEHDMWCSSGIKQFEPKGGAVSPTVCNQSPTRGAWFVRQIPEARRCRGEDGHRDRECEYLLSSSKRRVLRSRV